MYTNNSVLMAQTAQGKEVCLLPKMANRHGLIAGATGTGKTVTLKVMAESFSDMGVPVFLADIKGDLSGFVNPCGEVGFIDKRVAELSLESKGYVKKSFPVQFWDVFGKKGIPVRTTVSEMGPILLARILDLNPTQSAILSIVFQIADDKQLLLIDTKDLKAMLKYVSENAKELAFDYGNIAPQSVAAIVRAVVALEGQGGKDFFAEPALNVCDWIRTNAEGKGVVNILDCAELSQAPTMYGTFLLWMLTELYENMPEVGDLDKPRAVFFFDEAHMLFNGASKSLLEKVTQVVRLIRSKGVGIYFITQNPSDIPDSVLSQLGNKIEHALRAYTPSDQKAVKTAAASFRANPEFDTAAVISELGTGEALVSFLNEDGSPAIVERAYILPPQSSTAPIDDSQRFSNINCSEFYLKYKDAVDRESAYEELQQEAKAVQEEKEKAEAEALRLKEEEQAAKLAAAEAERKRKAAEKAAEQEKRRKEREKERMIKDVSNVAGSLFKGSIGKKAGASLVRGILGTIAKK